MPGHCSAFKSGPHILKVLPNKLRGLWIKGKALSMFRPWSLYLQLKKKKKDANSTAAVSEALLPSAVSLSIA